MSCLQEFQIKEFRYFFFVSKRNPTEQDLIELGVDVSLLGDARPDAARATSSSKPDSFPSGHGDVTPSSPYAGDMEDNDGPLRDGSWQTLSYITPAFLLSVHNKAVRAGKNNGGIDLYEWQKEQLNDIAEGTKTATLHTPYKLSLCAANGSGKDYIITAPTVVWLAITNIRALVIITSSSGVQLSAQTEGYIRALCEEINNHYGCQIFRIRQRFIKCLLSGSEIRLFATDEAGKAEGYHPLEPNAKMMIVVNEAKSVAEEIFGALRRCTGYTHWLNVSTPGEPKGTFYKTCSGALNWRFRRITAFDCPDHRSRQEIDEEKLELGEHSALYRSKNLALFTSLNTESIIPTEVIEQCEKIGLIVAENWKPRVGFDIAAGGDENAIVITLGNKIIKEVAWQESDTTLTADRFEIEMRLSGITKEHEFIFADDGGVGHAVIDMLMRRGWKTIRRMRNESRARNPDLYGNRGAELWYNVKRVIEERLFNVSGASAKLKDQLANRHYKKLGGKIKLEPKKEAIADGRPSPDRADAFILSLTGLTIKDFVEADVVRPNPNQREQLGKTVEEVQVRYDDSHTFAEYEKAQGVMVIGGKRNVYNSLRSATRRSQPTRLGMYDN